MCWTVTHDELLCREIIVVAPFLKKPSSRERGAAWTEIAENLNKLDQPKFAVSQRSVRGRFTLLERRRKEERREQDKASGIDVEETPLDTLLDEIIERIKEMEIFFAEKEKEKEQQTEEDKAACESVRNLAVESLAETRKRKGLDDCTNSMKKRRSSGSETVAYLREKAEKDHETKLSDKHSSSHKSSSSKFRYFQYGKSGFFDLLASYNRRNSSSSMTFA